MKLKDLLIIVCVISILWSLKITIWPLVINDCDYVIKKVHINKNNTTLRIYGIGYGLYRFKTDSIDYNVGDTIKINLQKQY